MVADNVLKARATKQAHTGIFEAPWNLRNPLSARPGTRRRRQQTVALEVLGAA